MPRRRIAGLIAVNVAWICDFDWFIERLKDGSMGAAPLLIMLAAVGVDYGWQPDGTTSSRGDNVRYIIQIPPHQIDQIKTIGEITSAIDPSIQGRVSQIVVRIGTETLPRDAGRVAAIRSPAQSDESARVMVSSEDSAQVPIPEIDFGSPSIASNRGDRANSPGSEAMMKPDPQTGGFALPEGLSNPIRTNPAVSTDPAVTGRDNQWDDLRGNTTASPPAFTSSGAAATSGTIARGPSTDPVDSAARSTWPGFVGPPAPTSTAAGNPQTVNQSSTTGPQMTGTNRRVTDPSDPNWSGFGTTPNFGTVPTGLAGTGSGSASGYTQSPSAANDLARQAVNTQSGSVSQPTAAGQTLSRDSAGNLVDRLGRPVDNLGRLIDPQSGQLVDAYGNWIDESGRKLDRLGRPLPAEVSESTARGGGGGGASLQPPLLPSQRTADAAYYGQSPYGPADARDNGVGGYAAGPPYSLQPSGLASSNPSAGYGQSLATGDPRQAAWQNTGVPNGYRQDARDSREAQYARDPRLPRSSAPVYDQDDFRSPSDTRLAASARGSLGGNSEDTGFDREIGTTRQPTLTTNNRGRSVAAQPFFNFVLLISLVGNAYLIFETGNLRRKFRNMIANVRATKISAQPAG
jgi:hypothetical protein